MRVKSAVIVTMLTLLSVSTALAATAVKLPAEVAGPAGTDVAVRLEADTGGASLSALGLRFTYDDTKFALRGVYKATLTDPMTLAYSAPASNAVDVQLSGAAVASPAGYHDVAWVVLRALAATSPGPLAWDQANTTINGAAPDGFSDGSLGAGSADVAFRVTDTANGARPPSSTATRTVDIVVAPPEGLVSFDITVEFDAGVVEATGVAAGDLPSAWVMTTNLGNPGKVLISLFGSQALTGTDPVTVARVQLHVTDGAAGATPLAITRFVTNDGKTTYRDDGLFTVSPDADNDGWTVADGDCNDANPAINPAAIEICDALNVDENCNGLADDADPGATGKTPWYRDADGDHYGDPAVSVMACDLPTGYVADATDCNDANAAINPAATEICDASNVDENCNGLADDADPGAVGQTAWYRDADGDAYGNPAVELMRCDPPVGYVANNADCNDADPAINPAATEICDASNVDENCNGLADDADPGATGQTPWYRDADGDTYGDLAVVLMKCDQPAGYVANHTDCNDANAGVNPGVAEICGNGIDDDCNGATDEIVGDRYVATTGTNGTNACASESLPCASIQHAIDVACPTETIHVQAGTFAENLRVPKALTLDGAGAASTTLLPADSKPNPCPGSSLCGSPTAATNLVLVEASNVTISNLTLDGDNTAIGSGIDARNGIVENFYAGVFDNTTVHHVAVKNVYLRGIYMSSGGSGFSVHDNTVANVQSDPSSIAIFNYGGTGSIADNVVDGANDAVSANYSRGTRFLRNVITHSASGVHSDNTGYYLASSTADLIEGNQVSDCAPYGYGVWVFTPSIAPSVRNNTVTKCDVGLGMYAGNYTSSPVNTVFENNVVDGQSACTVAFQILTTTWWWGPSDTRATLTGNTLGGCTSGVNVGEDQPPSGPPDYTKNVTLAGTGNTITGNQVGVLIDGVVDAGSAVDLSGNKIYGNTAGFTNSGSIGAVAECTWWGTDAGPVSPNNTTTGTVDYSPWAANASLTPVDYYPDGDHDGYGDALAAPVSQCGPPFPGHVTDNSDCNDLMANVHPGAYETCDEVDNNCSGTLNDAEANASCDDGNSCNVEACSALGACSHVSFSCSLAGNVYYYRDSGAQDGIESVSAKGVPGIALVMAGTASGNATSAAPDGGYALTAGGTETVTPQPKTGMFVKPPYGSTDYQEGISSFDATRIAQFAVGLRDLTPNQKLAGDVSDNGKVTSYDASLVAQWLVHLLPSFPVADHRGSDWAFVPASLDLNVSGGDSTGNTFAGILYGDVTANWGEPVAGFAAGAGASPEAAGAEGNRLLEALAAQAPKATPSGAHGGGAAASLEGRPAPSGRPAGAVLYIASRPVRLPSGDYKVVLGLQNADGIVALDLGFDFDPSVAVVRSVANVGLASSLILTQNGRNGHHAVSLFGVSPMWGSGNFLEVTFTATSSRNEVPFSAAVEANEGRIPVTFGPGLALSAGGQ